MGSAIDKHLQQDKHSITNKPRGPVGHVGPIAGNIGKVGDTGEVGTMDHNIGLASNDEVNDIYMRHYTKKIIMYSLFAVTIPFITLRMARAYTRLLY